MNSASLSAFAKVKGFPHVSYKDFIAPVAIFTAIFFSAGNAGIELVQDISSGYFKKLIILPINRLTVLLGKLTEVAVQAFLQGGLVIVLLYAVGVRFNTGFLGVLATFAMLMIFAMAWSCLGITFALRTQNARLVQSLFVLAFPFLYITTSQAPKQLLPPAMATMATYNPITYVIEGVRGMVLYGWGDSAIWKGFIVAVIMFIVMVGIALSSFKKALK